MVTYCGRGYPNQEGFGNPLHFSIISPLLIQMTFVFVSLLSLFVCWRFGYPELKKQQQTNALEGGTQITRDLGIP